MPAQRGTLNILGNAVFAALSLPVSAVTGVDDNRDGRLSDAELTAHMPAVQAQLQQRIHFFNGEERGQLELVMPMPEPDERDSTSLAGGMHVLVLMKAAFRGPLTALRFDTDLFGTGPGERQLTLKATRGAEAEAAVLTPDHPRHAFFRGAWLVFGDYIALGTRHILTGIDHLLFLITILVAASGWRYWLQVLTSFTVAHCITLALSAIGLLRVPASLVEPLIAASIVMMAVGNLRQRNRSTPHSPRIAIVFACGLLHGMGFASALGDLGLHGAYRWSSLTGFNLGIEAGQLLFLTTLLALSTCARRIVGYATRQTETHNQWDAPVLMPRVWSWIGVLIGMVWVLQRVAVVGRKAMVP